MSHTKFIENNINQLIQIYINESKVKQRGVLLLDFRKQEDQKVDVSYVELNKVPQDIFDIISKKIQNPLYNSVAFFCIVKPNNECLLFDINLDTSQDAHFNNLNKTKDNTKVLEESNMDVNNEINIDK